MVATPALIVTGAPGGPDNSLPGVPPGIWGGAPPFVDNTLPPPPPGIWPPPVGIWPPIQLPPGHPMPPGSIWPPVVDNTLPGYGRPSHPISGGGAPPGPSQGPGFPTPPIAPGGPPPQVNPGPGAPGHDLPSQKFLVAICAVSAGGGLKVIGYTVVDPSLDVWGGAPAYPSHQPVPGGERPANPIAPTPEALTNDWRLSLHSVAAAAFLAL
jgi:hypothetical protein